MTKQNTFVKKPLSVRAFMLLGNRAVILLNAVSTICLLLLIVLSSKGDRTLFFALLLEFEVLRQ